MRRIAAIVMAALAPLTAGCGAGESYSNEPRPPSPIVLTAVITPDEVSVSPESVGAGPVRLIITNQTTAAQQITFESTDGAAGFMQRTGPINPGDTATLKADVRRGRVIVEVQSDAIEPAVLTVDATRGNARDELLQP